jgi:hypothetical protein
MYSKYLSATSVVFSFVQKHRVVFSTIATTFIMSGAATYAWSANRKLAPFELGGSTGVIVKAVKETGSSILYQIGSTLGALQSAFWQGIWEKRADSLGDLFRDITKKHK